MLGRVLHLNFACFEFCAMFLYCAVQAHGIICLQGGNVPLCTPPHIDQALPNFYPRVGEKLFVGLQQLGQQPGTRGGRSCHSQQRQHSGKALSCVESIKTQKKM